MGLKNDIAQMVDLVEIFNFSINEQCREYEDLKLFIQANKPVFNVE